VTLGPGAELQWGLEAKPPEAVGIAYLSVILYADYNNIMPL